MHIGIQLQQEQRFISTTDQETNCVSSSMGEPLLWQLSGAQTASAALVSASFFATIGRVVSGSGGRS